MLGGIRLRNVSDRRLHAFRWLAAVLVSLGLIFSWSHRITGTVVEDDAAQLVLMAQNLVRHGVISMDEQPPLSPTNYREPLPVFVTALGIKLVDAALGEAPDEAYFRGQRVQLLKYQNVLWLALLSLSTFWAVRFLTSSFCLALLGTLLVNYPYWRSAADLVDTLYTDIPATAVLMLASVTAAIAATRRSLRFCAFAGVTFGFLALIKAAVLYVFVGTVALVAAAYLLQHASLRVVARDSAVMVIAFGCVVGPWIYRNYVLLGSAHIAQRAGVVLMYRAAYDQLTPEEYRGAFYAWAPLRLEGLFGRVLGFSQADLERNGRLQRLNESESSNFAAEDRAAERAGAPDRTLTYYRQARAWRVKLEHELYVAGVPQPDIAADDLLKERASRIILAHLGSNLATAIIFLWRGAILTFPVLLVALVVGLRSRRYDFIVFTAPAFGTVMLYALFTHFIPRYDLPALSIATVAVIVLAQYALRSRTQSAAAGP
jgi:hypothetical protein